MADSCENALELDQDSSQTIPKPWVFPVPKGTLQRIFGTSQVFQGFDNVKPKVTGLTVPLKVREYYHRGQECLEHGDWEMAVLFFSRALHLDSQLVDFYALRAEAYIQLCDFSSAAQNLRRAYSFQPDSKYLERLTFVLYLQGQYLLEHCEFMEALKIFSQAAELQPENPSFRYRCMACLLALRRHHDCLSLVTKEIKGGTVNADIYILRARLYNFFQKPDLCYQDLHSALLWDPKHPQARVLLKTMVEQSQQAHREAGALAVQGKLQLALQRINCAIENNPLDPNLFLFRGTMYRRLQEFESAVEDFLKALDMMSDSQEDMVQQAQRQLLLAYNDFAVHCYTQGAYQEGVLLLNKALKDEQREKGLYINRGDCFFQLGNLAFAEADYQQALALSPRDEGANTRMGLLQEKMGFCEHKRRQFQKAESHFSVAIQHNPQKAQYYLHRARNRQLLQDTSGARQDVATVLLLNPNQPKLFMLMTTLFPGMSVEEVLGSQVAHLARLQLQRLVASSPPVSSPQDLVGLLRERELERQKARDLQLSWSLEEPLLETVEEATPQILWMKRESSKEEDLEEEEEEKENLELSPDRMTSLSDSYPDHTSSGSTLGFRMTSTSEMDTSTSNQEYRSSPATAAPSSSSSPPKSQSSDSGSKREDRSLSHRPLKKQAPQSPRQKSYKTKATRRHRKSPREAEATQGHRQSPRKTETTRVRSQSLSETEATQDQSQSSREMETTQGHRQSPSETEATQGQSQSSSKNEASRLRPSKIKATQSPSRRLRKAKVAHGQSWRPSKAEATQGQSLALLRSSSKTKAFAEPSWSPSRSEVTQAQSQRPSKTEMILGQGHRPSKTEATQGQGHRPSKTEATQGQGHRPSKTEATHGQGHRPSKTEATQGQGHRPSKTEATHGQGHRPSKTEATQGQGHRPSKTEATHGQGHRPSETEATHSQSHRPSETGATQGQSHRPSEVEGPQGQSHRAREAKDAQGQSHRAREAKDVQDQSHKVSEAEGVQGQSHKASEAEGAQGQSYRAREAEGFQGQSHKAREAEGAQGQIHRTGEVEGAQGQSHRAGEAEGAQGQSHRAGAAEGAQGQSHKAREAEGAQGQSHKTGEAEDAQGQSHRAREADGAQGQSHRVGEAKGTQGQSHNAGEAEGTQAQSHKTGEAESAQSQSLKAGEAEGAQGQSCRTWKAEGAEGQSQPMSSSSSKTEVTWGPSPSISKTPTP